MYIVIETFDISWPTIVSNPDTGIPLVFDNEDDAYAEAEKCQRPTIVNIRASWTTKS